MSLPIPALYSADDIDVNSIGQGKIPVNIEPSLIENKNIMSRIEEAMKRLDNAVIGKTWFSWESLAEEAGLKTVELVKMAVRRMNALAKNKSKNGEDEKICDFNCILTNHAWRIEHQSVDVPKNIYLNSNDENKKFEGRVIPTGIKVLDEFLSPDFKEHGFYTPTTKTGKLLYPVITIEGGSGYGKSSLSLQIACNIMKNYHKGIPWCCLFYSLEQDSEGVIEHLKSHNYFLSPNEPSIENDILNLEKEENSYHKINNLGNKLLLPN